MPSVFSLTDATLDWLALLGPGLVTLLAVLFILIRRIMRARHFRRRAECAMRIRQDWEKIVSLQILPVDWLFDRLKRRMVEETALDRMDIAGPEEARALEAFFQKSGLLDCYKDAARHERGWRRREAIQKLGRMRAAESFPLVVEALGTHSPETTVESVRVLGGIGTPEAGAAIVRYIKNGSDCRPGIAEPALFNCYHGDPCQLARATLMADDLERPVLARVLAEVAIPGMPYDFNGLAADSNPDVRASAARILSAARPPGALDGLRTLAGDPTWFVRLRAIVALGGLNDTGAIPTLIEGACDRHRLVRSRAASVLGAIDGEELRIIRLVEKTNDRYALQALIADMERSGKLERMASMVADGEPHLEEALQAIIRSGAVRMLTEMAGSHSKQHVRQRLQKLLADGRRVVSRPLQHVPEESWSKP